CVLFHCLSGRPPFDEANEAAVLFAHVHRERPRLSELRPDLGDRFDRVLARGMARAPGDRFPDCAAFARAAVDASSPNVAGALQPPLESPLEKSDGRETTQV